MSFCDIRGETIDVGAFIRYTGTGTISKVVDLKEEDNMQWVKLDEPALWYAADSLEVVNEKDIIDIESVDKDTLKQVKDIKEGYEELNANLNDIQGCDLQRKGTFEKSRTDGLSEDRETGGAGDSRSRRH